MMLNVAITGGDRIERTNFARRLISRIEYSRSVFEVYLRTVPVEMEATPTTVFAVNQLLCDAMMTNEAMNDLAHIYNPLRLVVHRDTAYDVADVTGDDLVSETLRDETEAVYGKYRLDFVFKVGGSPTPPSGETVWELGPDEAADMINKVCDASGLDKNSGYTA